MTGGNEYARINITEAIQKSEIELELEPEPKPTATQCCSMCTGTKPTEKSNAKQREKKN